MASVFAHLATIADRIEADLEDVVADMHAEILAILPEFGADAAIDEEARLSSRGNVQRYCAVARRADDPPPADVPPEALDFARTVVRRGIESDVIYRGYRRGQRTLWRRWMGAARELVPPDELAEVFDVSQELLSAYVEDVLVGVLAEVQREREQVAGGALARRAETIRLILDGAPLQSAAASSRLGYDLARHHTAVVLWTDVEHHELGSLEEAAGTLARATGARTPLTLAAASSTLWAWIGSDGDLAPALLADAARGLAPHVLAAIGPTHAGAGGFRRSHEGALDTQRLMIANPATGPVATYEDLEITALTAHDPRRAADFVAATLGRLAEDTPTAARLRQTLRVYLDEADHAPRTAARLNTHRNTILHRVARASELLGHPPGERRLAVALALELHSRLGLER